MNICKLFLSIFLIFSENIRNISSANSSKARFNFFHDNIQNMHDVMNHIFIHGLKLHKNFTQSVKNRLLLTMHQDLVKIVTNNDKNEFENIADKPIVIDPYTNMLDEILQDETIFLPVNATEVFSTIIEIIDQNVLSSIHLYLKQLFLASNEPASDTEINLDINNSTKKGEPFLRMQNVSKQRINLKAWVPEGNSEESLYNRRLYGAKKTSIKKYPFVASVHVNNEFVCAGSIIGKGLVLTAATCLQAAKHRPEADVAVRLGGETTYDGALISVDHIHFHPSYDPVTLNNNLAVLKMVKHRLIKKNSVRRIKYEQSYTPIWNDAIVTILGWGAQDERNIPDPSQKLSVARLAVYKKKDCIEVYSKYYVVDANFCAGYSDRGSGACNKDVGNPAVIDGTLIGVVSFGPPHCGTRDTPTVFTRIGVYAKWLDTIIQLEVKKEHIKSTHENTKQIPHRPQPPRYPHQTHYSYNNKDYPEEIHILKDILNDITQANNSFIENIIQDGFNKEMVSIIESKKDGRQASLPFRNDLRPYIKPSAIKQYSLKPITIKQSIPTDYTIGPNTKFALHNSIDLKSFTKFYDSLRHQNVDVNPETTPRKNKILKKTKIYQSPLAGQMTEDMKYYGQPVTPNGPIDYNEETIKNKHMETTIHHIGTHSDELKNKTPQYDLESDDNDDRVMSIDGDSQNILSFSNILSQNKTTLCIGSSNSSDEEETSQYNIYDPTPLHFTDDVHVQTEKTRYNIFDATLLHLTDDVQEPTERTTYEYNIYDPTTVHFVDDVHKRTTLQKIQYLPSRKTTVATVALLDDKKYASSDNYEAEVYDDKGLSIEVNINTIKKTTPYNLYKFVRKTTNSKNLLFLIEADVGSDTQLQSKYAPGRSKYFQMSKKARDISAIKDYSDSESHETY